MSEAIEKRLNLLEEDVKQLKFYDQILEEKIAGRMMIAEHTNVFLDIIFIILSVVLWVITMQGWRNSREIEQERDSIRKIYEKDKEEVATYKNELKKDKERFKEEYDNLIKNATLNMESNNQKLQEGYNVMEEQYQQIIKDIKGVSEYYLELVAISHEPDLAERVFEYERILKNTLKYNISEEEQGRLYYYLSITLYQLATKTPDASNKMVFEWLKKASRYISSAISFGNKKGIYFYEKAKVELEKYRVELIKDNNFEGFSERIYEIEEYFEIAFKNTDIEFYMFEEIVQLLYELCQKVAKTQSDKRVIYDLIISWAERSRAFDKAAYEEIIEEIYADITRKVKQQNVKLDL